MCTFTIGQKVVVSPSVVAGETGLIGVVAGGITSGGNLHIIVDLGSHGVKTVKAREVTDAGGILPSENSKQIPEIPARSLRDVLAAYGIRTIGKIGQAARKSSRWQVFPLDGQAHLTNLVARLETPDRTFWVKCIDGEHSALCVEHTGGSRIEMLDNPRGSLENVREELETAADVYAICTELFGGFVYVGEDTL